MAVDPARLRTAEAQLNADPRVQNLIRRYRGSRVGMSLRLSDYGIYDLPPDHVFDVRSGRIVDTNTKADKFIYGGAAAAATAGLASGLTGGFGAAGGPAGGAAGGAIPTIGNYTNMGIQAGMGAAGTPIASMVTPAAMAGGGWRDTVQDVVKNAAGGGMNAWQRAAIAGLVGGIPTLLANRGMSDEERDVYGILRRDLEEARGDRETDRSARALQLQRMQYQNPLYQAVSQLAMSRLPTGAQRPMGDF